MQFRPPTIAINKTAVLILALTALATFLLFVLLGHYAHPSADDFCMASGIQQQGFLPYLWEHYLQWSGRYSGNALYGLYPLLFGMFDGYRFMPALLLLLLFTGIAFLLSRAFRIRMNRYAVAISALGLTTVYLLGLLSSASSLYWLAGALSYQSGNILMLFMLGLMLQLWDRQTQGSGATGTLLALLAVVFTGVGANETHMLAISMVVAVVTLLAARQRREMLKPWLLILAVTLISVAIVYFAPGNSVREASFELRHRLPRAIMGSLDMGLWTLKVWMTNPVFIVATLLAPFAVITMDRHAGRSFTVSKLQMLALLLLSLLLPFALQFPAWWAMGGWPPQRTVDAIHFIFLLGWFTSVAALTLHLRQVLPLASHLSGNRRNKSAGMPGALLMLTFALLFIAAVITHPKFQRAQQDLLYRAQPFNAYMLARYALIDEAVKLGQFKVIVPDFGKAYPRTIYFNDIMPSSRDWRNVCYASYFGLQKIKRYKPRPARLSSP